MILTNMDLHLHLHLRGTYSVSLSYSVCRLCGRRLRLRSIMFGIICNVRMPMYKWRLLVRYEPTSINSLRLVLKVMIYKNETVFHDQNLLYGPYYTPLNVFTASKGSSFYILFNVDISLGMDVYLPQAGQMNILPISSIHLSKNHLLSPHMYRNFYVDQTNHCHHHT